MTDITMHSDDEFHQLIENEPVLKEEFNRAVRRNNLSGFLALIDELYIYREEQKEELEISFNEERLEYE